MKFSRKGKLDRDLPFREWKTFAIFPRRSASWMPVRSARQPRGYGSCSAAGKILPPDHWTFALPGSITRLGSVVPQTRIGKGWRGQLGRCRIDKMPQHTG